MVYCMVIGIPHKDVINYNLVESSNIDLSDYGRPYEETWTWSFAQRYSQI